MTKGARVMLSTPPAIISVGIARPDSAGGGADRVKARAAEPVDRRARHLGRQPGQQQRHAGDVAVVLARLVGAAEEAHRRPRPSRAERCAPSARGSGCAPRSSARTSFSAPP